ncbi:MAG TPA: hypothetical protein VEK56_08655 [Vicinamibacterales bacterium]|nr:hypothetical protein [Vicinamibacterales bacterium]
MSILRNAASLAAIAIIVAVWPLDGSTARVSGAAHVAQAAGLSIIVIAGEDAVNIIQQKTAVAPIVEVRDRNDLPVSGVPVTFAIRGVHKAAFTGGVQRLTITTNAAGRATVSGITPLGSGTYQIDVAAAYQGQTTTVTISQTNVLTGAVAAAGAAGAGAAAAAGGAGGLSAAAVGGIAAAIGGGTLVALKAGSGKSNDSSSSPAPTSPSPPAPTGPTTITYTGPVEGQIVITTTTTTNFSTTCVVTWSITGTMTVAVQQQTGGTLTGNAFTTGTQIPIAATAAPYCDSPSGSMPFNRGGVLMGTATNFGVSQETSSTGPTPTGGYVTVTTTFTFSGALMNGMVSGTITYGHSGRGEQSSPFNGIITSSGSTTMQVTLR